MNLEQLLKAFSEVLFSVFQQVESTEDLLNDKQKMALIASIIAALDELQATTEQTLPAEITTAYTAGLSEAQAALQELLTSAPTSPITATIAAAANLKPVIANRIHLNALNNLISDTLADLKAAFRTARLSAVETINDTINAVKQEIASGIIQGNHSRVTAKRVAKAFAQGGLTSFITRDGKRLPLDVYARLVARVKTRQAQVTGAENRYKEAGVTTVRIFENAVTCPVCTKYRNMIVVISGSVPGFKTKNEVPLPPYHPNCRGTIRPVVLDFLSDAEQAEAKALTVAFDPGKDNRTPPQRKAYEKEQEIRRKAREETKYYERMKAVLGDQAPKTVGAFRRMKRSNSKGWQKVQAEYLKAVRE